MMLIDTHAHLDFPEFAEDLDHVLLRAKQAGVERIITIGTTLQSSRRAIQLAERYPQIYASVGIHPNSASQERKDFLSELEEMVKHPKVVAIGETGLDYHRLPSKQADAEVSQATFGADSFGTMEVEIHDEAEKAAQSTVFEQHLELAAAAGKSVVIHQRDSWEDTIELLRKYSTRVRAVMHCFDAGLAQAQEVVDLGHFVSFTGIVSLKMPARCEKPPNQSQSNESCWKPIAPTSSRCQTVGNAVNPPSSARLPHSLRTFAAGVWQHSLRKLRKTRKNSSD
jgi:TatD DNase family protein